MQLMKGSDRTASAAAVMIALIALRIGIVSFRNDSALFDDFSGAQETNQVTTSIIHGSPGTLAHNWRRKSIIAALTSDGRSCWAQ